MSTGHCEWLEANGLGGFAMGTVDGRRTRRYHGLLVTSSQSNAGRIALVNGFDAWVETSAGTFAITSQFYAPGVTSPAGQQPLDQFQWEPWPHWTFQLADGTQVEQELFVPHGSSAVVVRWWLGARTDRATLMLRPFLSGRDYHSLHHENPAFRFDAKVTGSRTVWRPYEGLPAIAVCSNGQYTHDPDWYRNFLYTEEQARGLDCVEDLASPGVFRWDLTGSDAVWIAMASGAHELVLAGAESAADLAQRLREREAGRRARVSSPLERAADAYLVERGDSQTVIAGYPWFTDWGRDTFIALRGFCLATGRLDVAERVLLSWSDTLSEGMLPNRFPDTGEQPQYNSVDASLWFVIVVDDFLERADSMNRGVATATRERLWQTVEGILTGYFQGTRFGIKCDIDGLLAAGESGVQLTWMDAKVGDWIVTPRVGKPVEVQALWLNTLRIGERRSDRWNDVFERGLAAFQARFWNEAAGSLYDVVDADHQAGTVDAAFRPNQVLAIGGLPVPLIDGERARRIVDAVEQRLWTPLGLRSLAADEPGYVGRYEGGVRQRDGAYHQGTVWPWLMGPFIDAWLRVRGETDSAKREAYERFAVPLLNHLHNAGLGHVSEIADGTAPHSPRGCPFQAWSLSELLRVLNGSLAGVDASF